MIGSRVVVRRLVPGETGPTGGPAFTDVLGICEAWDGLGTAGAPAGAALIRTEDGTLVPIPLELIVSGKPVPPRPSVRHRVGVREAESHAAVLWPGIDREALGEWELRAPREGTGRPRKRTSSALAVGDPGMPFEEAAARVQAFYAARDRAALVGVEADGDPERAFLAAGWRLLGEGETDFLLGGVSRARRALGRPAPTAASSLEATDSPEGRRLIARAQHEGVEIGRAEAGIDRDWCGLHGLWVEPEHRRTGVGRALIGALLEAAAEAGATVAWLHVETVNEAALRLYTDLGLKPHHRMRYLSAPG